eukprot:UN00323
MTAHCENKYYVFFQISRGFGGIPGPEAYQNKNDTPNVDACVQDVLTAPSNVYLNLGLNLFHSYFSLF